MDGHLTDYLGRPSRASWPAPRHATGQEHPTQEGTSRAKRDAARSGAHVRGAARGSPWLSGAQLLAGTARVAGRYAGLSATLAPERKHRAVHDPGKITLDPGNDARCRRDC
jgi:hypothetical protein